MRRLYYYADSNIYILQASALFCDRKSSKFPPTDIESEHDISSLTEPILNDTLLLQSLRGGPNCDMETNSGIPPPEDVRIVMNVAIYVILTQEFFQGIPG